MELIELHVHQRHAAAIGDGETPSPVPAMRVGRDLEDAAETTGGDQHRLGVNVVNLAGLQFSWSRRRSTARRL